MALKLRRIKEDDLQTIMEWRMLPEVTKYMYSDPLLTLQEQKKWFDKVKQDESARYWIIELDNVSIGVLSITSINYISQRCDWAYYIADTSFRGRGIGKSLECNIYDYVFDSMGMNKLCCEVLVSNQDVIKIHEKFGAQVEGTRKQHIIKAGIPLDIVEMAILKDEWEKIKHTYTYDNLEIEG